VQHPPAVGGSSDKSVGHGDARSTHKSDREKLDLEHTREFVSRVFGPDLHALRVLSLKNGVADVLNAAVLSIHAIGQAYANLANRQERRQADRPPAGQRRPVV
jgi:hypothetical protein